MVNYREILRLSTDENYSVRELLATVHCSYQSYRETISAAKAKGILAQETDAGRSFSFAGSGRGPEPER